MKKTRGSHAKRRVSTISLTLAALLVVGTLVLYSPVREHDFINYDDPEYVLNNPHVTAGFSWQTVTWSLASREQSNWHPVTWWSHALDYELFGSDAGDHHLVSVVIHSLNALLIFLLLHRLGGGAWESFFVAALFAWHPFNVESIAWVAERKNVLSTLFFLLTLAAYARYTHKSNWKSYCAVVVLFVLALASKPMAVTLPFLLLLLDYWPLQRAAGWIPPASQFQIPQKPVRQLILEKLPLFALSAASSAVTIWAQKVGGWRSLQAFPFPVRLENAIVAYAVYIWKTLCPYRFALFYPHPGSSLPWWKPALAAAILPAISITVWVQRKPRPYLIVGWLWFLGTLFPTIGIVQVGDQAMADRYAYLPTIGLFVMIVWSIDAFFDRIHLHVSARWAVAGVVLAILGTLTLRQLKYWEDSVTIWSHTLEVTGANPLAERKLALALASCGDSSDAMTHFLNAVRLDPDDISAHVTLGVLYANQGQLDDGIREFQAVARVTDGKELSDEDTKIRGSALLDLGFAQASSKQFAEAVRNVQSANMCTPDLVDRTGQALSRSLATKPSEENYVRLALVKRAQGKPQEAASLLNEAIQMNPGYTSVQQLLNLLK